SCARAVVARPWWGSPLGCVSALRRDRALRAEARIALGGRRRRADRRDLLERLAAEHPRRLVGAARRRRDRSCLRGGGGLPSRHRAAPVGGYSPPGPGVEGGAGGRRRLSAGSPSRL